MQRRLRDAPVHFPRGPHTHFSCSTPPPDGLRKGRCADGFVVDFPPRFSRSRRVGFLGRSSPFPPSTLWRGPLTASVRLQTLYNVASAQKLCARLASRVCAGSSLLRSLVARD